MQNLRQIKKTELNIADSSVSGSTYCTLKFLIENHVSLQSASSSQVTKNFAIHFIYNKSVSTPGLQFDHIDNLPEGRRKSLVDFPLSVSVSDGLGSLTSALRVFSSSPGLEGFSSRQGARAATSLLSQPLPPVQHAHTHAISTSAIARD